MLDDISDVLS